MELWIPSSVSPQKIQFNLQKWLDDTSKHAYQNILQDRVNSLYPTLSEPRTLYILKVSNRTITLEISPLAPPQCIVPVKQCANCYEEDAVVRHTLPCNHTFHLHCIDKWLRKNRTCPMCRYKVY